MSLENGRLPENHELPLNVERSELLARSGESDVWKADVIGANEQEHSIALKQSRKEEFATDEEMRKSKEYYEYLKAFPGFGKFIPDTLYFKARLEPGSPAQSYCIQQLFSGKTINRLTDAELAQDPEVLTQLLEFTDAAIAVLRGTRKEWGVKPDFGKSPDDDEHGTYMANSMLNPRYSNNIFVADSPDERGQRVFFLDTGQNVAERTKTLWRVFQREIVGRRQESRLKEWKKQLESQFLNR